MSKKIVSYIRVSTQRQKCSGLGLEAQQFSVKQFAQSTDSTIVKEFVEVESGKKNNRPQLLEAIELCELIGARLIIAKLDRLSRNLAFIACMQESGVPFTCCDMPDANETLIAFMAIMAQTERLAISERTKLALKAAKARGTKLGGPCLGKARRAAMEVESHKLARIQHSEKSKRWNTKLLKVVNQAKANGCATLKEIAQYLNELEIRTRKGKDWTPSAVRRVLRSGNQS